MRAAVGEHVSSLQLFGVSVQRTESASAVQTPEMHSPPQCVLNVPVVSGVHAVPFAGLYTAQVATLAKALPDIGDGLAAQLAALQRDPTAHGCERMASNLEGARQTVLRLREALMAGKS